jgi:glycerate-2-kinase
VKSAPHEPRALLTELFAAAVAAVEPGAAVERALARGSPAPRPERCVVLAAGKAAVAMARAWHARVGAPRTGLVVSREPGELPAPWRALVGGHPLPTVASAEAGRAALAIAESAAPQDTFVVLLSGGASALLSAPLPGLTLGDLRATTERLLRAGAEIRELNCVRKHLTAASGGRLAARTRAHATRVLALSDVLGDDLATIGSGPCAPDPTTFGDAERVLRARGVWEAAPAAVRAHIACGIRGEIDDTPKPGAACFARVRHEIVASNAAALESAEQLARARGLAVTRRAAPLRGEARDVGAQLAREALGLRGDSPCLLIAGGETTVTVRGNGRGGRCQELALGAALALEGQRDVTLLAASTDGSDGPTDAAGAFADGETLARGSAASADARAALEDNDAYAYFAREGGLFTTGATGTNALDVALVLALPRS